MKVRFLDDLACPKCSHSMRVAQPAATPAREVEIRVGLLECKKCRAQYPIVRGLGGWVAYRWHRINRPRIVTVLGQLVPPAANEWGIRSSR